MAIKLKWMIKIAAIKANDKIYTGTGHIAIGDTHPIVYKCKNRVDGFLTDDGKFLDRAEAAEEAFKCGQISEKVNSLQSWMIQPE